MTQALITTVCTGLAAVLAFCAGLAVAQPPQPSVPESPALPGWTVEHVDAKLGDRIYFVNGPKGERLVGMYGVALTPLPPHP